MNRFVNRSLTGAVVVAATLLTTTRANVADTPLADAHLAWERGHYVDALTGYLEILDSPTADHALESIALQTGELFVSTEVTADGAAPQVSRDGKYLSYATGAGALRTTRVVTAAAPGTIVAELNGWGLSFAPDAARLAYFKRVDSAEVVAAQAAVDQADATNRTLRLATAAQAATTAARLTIRDLATGIETDLDTGALRKSALAFAAGGTVLFAGAPHDQLTQIYAVGAGRPAAALTTDATEKALGALNASGTTAVVVVRAAPGGTGRGGGRGGQAQPGTGSFGVLAVADGTVTSIDGSAPSFSADGDTLVYLTRLADETQIMAASPATPSRAVVVRKGRERIDAPAVSPDGTRIAFQMMPKEDWEIYIVNRDGTGETRLTREIQHDLLPQFLTPDRLLAVIGEARHRRSYIYDVASRTRTRLFHNNSVRTIAPEYSWQPSGDGRSIVIVAERDGDTVSPERGVYLTDLSRKVSRTDLLSRVAASLATEEALRAKGRRLFAPLADAVTSVVKAASVDRVYQYQKRLFDFDSKHITQPGNALAAAYLAETYQSFGYTPELQWFERPNAHGGKTANVLATLPGTVNPELVYVVSSHYDSVAVGPGADDDSSGTAALLETARILARRPQPATIIFASFTGEEAGLLGSREFVRRALDSKMQLVGALNNDMIGWSNDQRLDNTIRYSNPGIRDIQHGAAIQFTNLITYDALYYKGTDAAAYYEAYGDIVGGIGSYPVLGNPHYHQTHDLLDTINHPLVTEVAKTTAATLMMLASSPSRLSDLKVDSFSGGAATLSWKPSVEKGVASYLVMVGAEDTPEKQVRVATPSVALPAIAPGTVVSVKAINNQGLEGWDWARVVVK